MGFRAGPAAWWTCGKKKNLVILNSFASFISLFCDLLDELYGEGINKDARNFSHDLHVVASSPLYSSVSTATLSLLYLPFNNFSTCGNYYWEFGRGMYVLNLNRCLNLEDSGSLLSCNVVKVPFQT